MVIYLDTSALAKRYRLERGTEVANALINRSPRDFLITSYLTFLEITAVVETRIKPEVPSTFVNNVRGAVSRDFETKIETLPVEDPLLKQAHAYIVRYALRAPDAIQLCSCVEWRQISPETDILLFSADKKLNKAARSEGISVLDPTEPDALKRLDALFA